VPPRRDDERHEQVLDAAVALIRQKGMEGTSLQDVADAVGIKKGSLANYFSTKAELADLVQERFTEIANEQLNAIAQRKDLGPEERLCELLRFHAEHCALRMSSPVMVSFMHLWAPANTDLGRRQLEIREQYESVFREQIVACVRKRIFRKVDVDIVVHGLVGMMTWTAFWYDADKCGPLGPLIDQQIDMCLRGLRPRPRGAKRPR
jgi:AcrR family transcriptional regulator